MGTGGHQPDRPDGADGLDGHPGPPGLDGPDGTPGQVWSRPLAGGEELRALLGNVDGLETPAQLIEIVAQIEALLMTAG